MNNFLDVGFIETILVYAHSLSVAVSEQNFHKTAIWNGYEFEYRLPEPACNNATTIA